MREEKKYCKPQDAGLQSTHRAVGRRIAKLLDALGDINCLVVESGNLNHGDASEENNIEADCWHFRMRLVDKLRAEGWRIDTPNNKFRVLPPK